MIDAHVHAIEEHPDYSDYDALSSMVSCVAKPDEWSTQISLNDTRIVKSYGVHPWYADQWVEESKERLEVILSADGNAQVGEIGLDSKRGKVADQMPAFAEQLSMAEKYGRIVSIHDIGCEKEVLDSIRGYRLKGIILHSYGSDSYVKPFSEQNCYFSISPRILSRSDVRVKRLMDAIPDDRLLFETDSPNYGKGFGGMADFIGRISEIVGRSPDELESLSTENLGRLLG